MWEYEHSAVWMDLCRIMNFQSCKRGNRLFKTTETIFLLSLLGPNWTFHSHAYTNNNMCSHKARLNSIVIHCESFRHMLLHAVCVQVRVCLCVCASSCLIFWSSICIYLTNFSCRASCKINTVGGLSKYRKTESSYICVCNAPQPQNVNLSFAFFVLCFIFSRCQQTMFGKENSASSSSSLLHVDK